MVLSSDPEMMCRPSGEYATDVTTPVCPFRASPTTAPVSVSQIRMVLSRDPVTMWVLFGDQVMQLTPAVCPIHVDGGVGHDNNFPLCIPMALALVNLVLKRMDKGDCEGRKGPVEM